MAQATPYSYTERKRIRKSFGKRGSVLNVPYLLTMQKDSYVAFLQKDVPPQQRKPEGLTLAEAEADGWPLTPNAHLYVEGDLLRADEQMPYIPVGVTYAPLLNADGNLRNVIVTVRDITHFRNAEEIKATFISIVSHELKTPVALIKGYASTLRRDDARWDKHILQDSLAVIETEADRITPLS